MVICSSLCFHFEILFCCLVLILMSNLVSNSCHDSMYSYELRQTHNFQVRVQVGVRVRDMVRTTDRGRGSVIGAQVGL
jgi:hypothetical protein